VRPYRTTDNKIAGAVITLVDINGKEEPDGRKPAKNAKRVPLPIKSLRQLVARSANRLDWRRKK
jgi:hypothetical protein